MLWLFLYDAYKQDMRRLNQKLLERKTAHICSPVQKEVLKGNIFFVESDALMPERVNGIAMMKFFYCSLFGRFLRSFLARRWVSAMVGWFLSSRLSKRNIEQFVKQHQIDMREYEIEETKQFASFNDFFSRKLKAGARRVDARPNVVVSPADSKVLVIPDLSKCRSFFVKGDSFDLKRFLGNDLAASRCCEGGSLMIFRLAPNDFHRFWFPIRCVPGNPRHIRGMHESVNPIAYASNCQPLLTNERMVVPLHPRCGFTVFSVIVGAWMVGSINLSCHPFEEVKKGDEFGYFRMGGSTVALVFPKGMKLKIREDILANSKNNLETRVKVGEAVAESCCLSDLPEDEHLD